MINAMCTVNVGSPSIDVQGFYARPEKAADGSLNLLSWDAGIPGKAGVSFDLVIAGFICLVTLKVFDLL